MYLQCSRPSAPPSLAPPNNQILRPVVVSDLNILLRTSSSTNSIYHHVLCTEQLISPFSPSFRAPANPIFINYCATFIHYWYTRDAITMKPCWCLHWRVSSNRFVAPPWLELYTSTPSQTMHDNPNHDRKPSDLQTKCPFCVSSCPVYIALSQPGNFPTLDT